MRRYPLEHVCGYMYVVSIVRVVSRGCFAQSAFLCCVDNRVNYLNCVRN